MAAAVRASDMLLLYSGRIADESPDGHSLAMSHLLVFGPGYTAQRVAAHAEARGWKISRIGRALIDERRAVDRLIDDATHILSSVPPDTDGDPVLARHGARIARAPAQWIGYLSSTGVYGDCGGAWIDEQTPVAGRRPGRNAADAAWASLRPEARVFRLPGIYGPGRSALERVREGKAHRIAIPGQIFSRIHVDDIAAGVMASTERGPAGIYNLADDMPAPQNDVVACAARLLGRPLPPLMTIEEAALSPMARAFYAENRRVANGKAKRLLGWTPRFRDFGAGLRACLADTHAPAPGDAS